MFMNCYSIFFTGAKPANYPSDCGKLYTIPNGKSMVLE